MLRLRRTYEDTRHVSACERRCRADAIARRTLEQALYHGWRRA